MRLVLSLDSPQQHMREFEFSEHGGYIGRDIECDWVLECPHGLISRRHALISFDEDSFWLSDGSRNGVYHNESEKPVGRGSRVAVADGDTFRMGNFLFRARLVALSRADETIKSETAGYKDGADIAAIDSAGGMALARPALRRSSPLGGSADAFSPPRAFIPDEWEIHAGSPPKDECQVPALAVSRRLSALQQAASRALWSSLLPEACDEVDAELSPEAAAALGRSLRICIDGLLALQAEHNLVESNLVAATKRAKAETGSSPEEQAIAFCQGFLIPDQLDQVADDLRDIVVGLVGRHRALHGSFSASLATIVEQFAPRKFEERWRVACVTSSSTPLHSRVRARLFRSASLWGFYQQWHRQQKQSDYRPVHQLFERKLRSVYARLKRDFRHEAAPDDSLAARLSVNAEQG